MCSSDHKIIESQLDEVEKRELRMCIGHAGTQQVDPLWFARRIVHCVCS